MLIITSDTFVIIFDQNPLATKQAVDEDGWLNTGDLGWIAPFHSRGKSRRCGGVIVLEGRAKDTIVLSTGILEACGFPSILVHLLPLSLSL